MSPATGPSLIAPELTVHVFVPVTGPHAAALDGYLRALWGRCRDELGMDMAMTSLGVPASIASPSSSDRRRTSEAVAAQRRGGPGVFQSLLRREHDVLCLSVMLAPDPAEASSWSELGELWSRAMGPAPEGLVGTAQLYLARLGDPGLARAVATEELGRVCRTQLPAPTPPSEFSARGTATGSGFAVWEADTVDDTRLTRRIVVVAARDRDAELSAWTWTRGGMALTPFARYLLQAARLRYHLRVWAGGEPVHTLRQSVDDSATVVVSWPGVPGRPEESDVDGLAEDRVATLRRNVHELVAARSRLRQLRLSLDATRNNLENYLDPGPGEDSELGPFADDMDMARWFGRQIDDDLYMVSATLDRARSALRTAEDLGRTMAQATHTTAAARPTEQLAYRVADLRGEQPPATIGDIHLTGTERADLLTALASAFPTDAAAEPVLRALGLPRQRRRGLDYMPPRDGWVEILTECDNGAVHAPYRRLVGLAIELYPYNGVFAALARRHDIGPSSLSGDDDQPIA
ncbi:CATRA conflict system CASPASE/TPR repeat-associated protein [Frankia gtarii]|uniref:CATRA conflict system CASPASE/TPR repeat-associated protein n=1 Tax=Frankia gtarii TaxID=2950102 RepID=UPI0021BF1B70|nr:CATRA conflict system CASPASE/TPR repeat-associated protein [Frankia gtarii]